MLHCLLLLAEAKDWQGQAYFMPHQNILAKGGGRKKKKKAEFREAAKTYLIQNVFKRVKPI